MNRVAQAGRRYMLGFLCYCRKEGLERKKKVGEEKVIRSARIKGLRKSRM
jgi:hypothetical protein